VIGSGNYAQGVIGGVIGDYLGATIICMEVLVYMTLTMRINETALAGLFVLDIFESPLLRLAFVFGIPFVFMRGAGELPNSVC
jgi:hypothetical protein